jgi:hypothetical protein
VLVAPVAPAPEITVKVAELETVAHNLEDKVYD